MRAVCEVGAKRQLVGLWSPAPGCGKTTVARYMMDSGFIRVGFADPLRRMVMELLCSAGYPMHQAQKLVYELKETPLTELPGAPTARHLLRTLGTEWGRDLVHEELWMAVWAARANGLPKVVADDVRFPNEAANVLALGGELWAVTRPYYMDSSGHRSEGGLGGMAFSRVIVNDGTLGQLERQVAEALGVPA